jgi:hypothetical protein
MGKEKWKDDILNSLQGMERAEPNPFLYTRIEARLQADTGLSKLQIRLAGALMIALLMVNVWIAGTADSSQRNNTQAITTSYNF